MTSKIIGEEDYFSTKPKLTICSGRWAMVVQLSRNTTIEGMGLTKCSRHERENGYRRICLKRDRNRDRYGPVGR